MSDSAKRAGRLRVASIVEGHGEANAIPLLLDRIWREVVNGEYLEPLRPPIRQPRDRLARNKDDALTRAVELAARKLDHSRGTVDDPELILILIDADRDPACQLGPDLLETAQQSRPDKRIACVLPVVEYETWFVAACESLPKFLKIASDESVPADPETQRIGKRWIEKRFAGAKYSETLDQAKMTMQMDLKLCRERSPSFDKLCRELENVASQTTS